MTTNLRHIIAIEFLAACQGIDFRQPLQTSPSLKVAHDVLRVRIPFATQDRLLADDIALAAEIIGTPAIQALAAFLLPSFA
jgi:histidine ammonia-lyase